MTAIKWYSRTDIPALKLEQHHGHVNCLFFTVSRNLETEKTEIWVRLFGFIIHESLHDSLDEAFASASQWLNEYRTESA